MPNEKTKEEYNPISCDHKKPSGFSAFDLLSHSSGSGPNSGHECNISVCLRCGEVKVSGKKLVDGKWNYFHEEFSLYYPDAVAAIVKNCNYMNTETDGYAPFEQSQTSLIAEQQKLDDLNTAKIAEQAQEIERLKGVLSEIAKEPNNLNHDIETSYRIMEELATNALNK